MKGILGIISFLLIVGSVGALEHGNIGFIQTGVQSAIGFVLLLVSVA